MDFSHQVFNNENALVVYVEEGETTYNELARMFTIGGEQYANAIKNLNNDTGNAPVGNYIIPVSWLNAAGKTYYVSTFNDPRLAVEITGAGSREKILGIEPKKWALILGAAAILYLLTTEKQQNESFD